MSEIRRRDYMLFTHLQVKSGFSLMESTITIDKLVKRAKELQFKSLALTDENVLYGMIPFYKACKENRIKTIIGMTIKVENQEEIEKCILLAKNNQGYQRLIKLSSHINTTDIQAVEKDQLHQYANDLIGILPVYHSQLREKFKTTSFDLIKEEINDWYSIFKKDNFYLGIGDHGLNEERELQQLVKAFHDTHQTPVVAINDVYYLKETDVHAFDLLQAMKKGKKFSRKDQSSKNRHHQLRSSVEMKQLFDFWPEVLEETNRIANQCEVTIDFHNRMLPSYPVPDGESSHAYLKKLCQNGMKHRYMHITDEAYERLNYELDIIRSMDYSDYFLIVWDFIKYAKSRNILVGPGRGSSAGSLVAYVLGITEVDPLKHNLLFERFLNPE